LKQFLKNSFSEIKVICIPLYKILIPFIFIIKILEEIGVVKLISNFFEPVVQLMGLPAELGIVWVTAIIINVYAGIVVFINVVPTLDLTVAQITVLTLIILIAHNILVESSVSRAAGVSFFYAAFLRIGMAFVAGVILSKIYLNFGFLQEKYSLVLEQQVVHNDYYSWIVGQLKNLAYIFLIICTLVISLNFLKAIGVEKLIRKLLEKPLMFMGISPSAINIIIVGLTIGIQFGGGLLIREAKSGAINKQSILLSLSLLNLVHAVIEDTILMTILGGHISGILFFRVIFSLMVVLGILFLYKKFTLLFNKLVFVKI
jgi:spore maturation protein SpmB